MRLFEVDGEEKVVSVGVIRDVDDGHDTEDNKTSGEPQDAETDGFSGSRQQNDYSYRPLSGDI